MKKKLLVSCGCSFTYGFANGTTFNPYANIVAQAIDYEHVNLSVIGSSNYAITKQVEHALTLDPDLIIVGATTPLRFDFIEDVAAIRRTVTFDDLRGHRTGKTPDKLESRSFFWFLENCTDKNLSRPKRARMHKIYEFLTANTNYFVKADQDRFMLLGSLFKMEKNNIPYMVVDFDNILHNTDLVNLVSHNFRDLCIRFHVDNDPRHFNQQGHEFLAQELVKILGY